VILGYLGEWGGLELIFAIGGGALLSGLALVRPNRQRRGAP
jgi:hypothetical protein